MVNKIRQAFIIALSSYREWLLNYRQIISLMIMLLLMYCVSAPLVEVSVEVGVPLNILEPFIACYNNKITGVVICLFIFLMSDFPRMEGNNGYMLIRTGRMTWLAGKIIFSFSAIMTFVISLFTIMTIPALKSGFIVNGWSYFMRDFKEKYEMFAIEKLYYGRVVENVYNHFLPYETLLHTVMLFILAALSFSLITMIFNFLNKKVVGVGVNVLLIVIGFALIETYQMSRFLFPVANLIISEHNTALHNVCPIWYSYIYFGGSILILLAVNIVLAKRVTIQKDGEK